MPKKQIVKYIATIILILFCIQYIPIESRAGVSVVKLVVSALCPIFTIMFSPKISKVVLLCVIYYFIVIVAALRFPETLRWSTVLYLGTFLIVFVTYYNLIVYEQAFSKEYYIGLLKHLIVTYSIVLIVQQCFIVVGIKTFPLINLVQDLNRGIGANSLSYEPSTSAMILSSAFLSLIRMYEIKYGYKPSVKDLYRCAKFPTIGFIWSMLTMGSGTAFICIFLLSIYFINFKSRNTLRGISVTLLAVLCFTFIEYEPLNRARDTVNAFLTLDINNAIDTDASSAYRTQLWINTITKLDLFSINGWLGHGVDYGKLSNEFLFNPNSMIGNIADYGFLSFLVLLLLIYNSMIKHFFSFETLFFAIVLLATLNNEPFRWGCMMLFSTVRYFQIQKQLNSIEYDSEKD